MIILQAFFANNGLKTALCVITTTKFMTKFLAINAFILSSKSSPAYMTGIQVF